MELFSETYNQYKYENDDNDNNHLFLNIFYNYTFRKLMLFSGLNCIFYFIFYNLLTPIEIFKKLNYNKKMYIIKNITKVVLFYIFVIGTKEIFEFIINDVYDMNSKLWCYL